MTEEQFKQMLAVQTAQVSMLYGIFNNLRVIAARMEKGKPAGFSFQDVAKVLEGARRVPEIQVALQAARAPARKKQH